MTDITDTFESPKFPNEYFKNKLPLSTNVVGENNNEAGATNVEGTKIVEGENCICNILNIDMNL